MSKKRIEEIIEDLVDEIAGERTYEGKCKLSDALTEFAKEIRLATEEGEWK